MLKAYYTQIVMKHANIVNVKNDTGECYIT